MSTGDIKKLLLGAAISTLLTGCAEPPSAPALAAWTQALAASQPEGPELTVYKNGETLLTFVGVEHDGNPNSLTHQLIAAAFEMSSPRTDPTSCAIQSFGKTMLSGRQDCESEISM